MPVHGPLYHFHTPGAWMNDPKPFFRAGEYHVFFQYNPASPRDAYKHWGHAVSRDLVSWDELPVALAPTPGGPDKDGCWTGCVVADGQGFRILYTGVFPQCQCLAASEDMLTWTKHPANPVIPASALPEGFGPCFRDPCAWRDGETWRVIVGSEKRGTGGAALLYESRDLVKWDYRHVLSFGDEKATGFDYECPDLFRLGGRHVLLTSRDRTHWQVGDMRDLRFRTERTGVTDGGSFYAAKTLLEDGSEGDGRRILFGWVTEARPPEAQMADGWSGALSLPRELALRGDGALGIEPVEELKGLRGKRAHFDALDVPDGGEVLVDLPGDLQGDAVEVVATFAPPSAAHCGLVLRASPDLKTRVEIGYNLAARRFGGAPLELAAGEPLTIRAFVDRSIIEAFANGRAAHTMRTYPARDDALRVGLFSRGGGARVESLDVYAMRAARSRPAAGD